MEALTRLVDPSDLMQLAGMQALRPKTSCLAAHRSLWQRPRASPVCSLHQHVWTARSRSSYHKRTLQLARTWRVARHGTCGLKVQAGWGDWFKKGDNTSVTRKEYQPQVRRALHICNSASTACWQPAVHSFCCQSLTLHGAGCKGACLSCWPMPTQHASGIAPGVALSKHGQPCNHVCTSLQVDKVNALESEMRSLSDQQLAAKTAELKERAQGKGESLDSLLPEAFAVSARPRLLYIEQSTAPLQQQSTVDLYLPLPKWLHSTVKQTVLVAEAWGPTATQCVTPGSNADHA